MSLKQLALKVGLSRLKKLAKPATIDDIKVETARAINDWAIEQSTIPDGVIPFPFVDDGSLALSRLFVVERWRRVWLQWEFWVKHRSTDTQSRWINGRTAPMAD